jgi:hypothetical protein
VILRLKAPVTGLVEMVRQKLEEMGIEVLFIMTEFKGEAQPKPDSGWKELLKLNPEELFQEFYLHKFPEEKQVPEELLQDMKSLWEEARHAPPPT